MTSIGNYCTYNLSVVYIRYKEREYLKDYNIPKKSAALRSPFEEGAAARTMPSISGWTSAAYISSRIMF